MPGDLPNRITSGSRSGDAANKVRETLRSHFPLQSPGVRTQHTIHGIHREVDEVAGGYASDDAPPGGISYEGEWDPLKTYLKNAMVRVSSIPDAVTPGVNYTGVFIAVQAVPAGQRPVYPENLNPALVYWNLLSLGIREINIGNSTLGSAKMLVGSGDPY